MNLALTIMVEISIMNEEFVHVILVCGLGFSDGLTFHAAGTDITLTSLAIAALSGIVLNSHKTKND